MLRKGLFLVFIFIQQIVIGGINFQAYIKINTSECQKCYAAQVYTDELVRIVDITLVFKENYSNPHKYLKAQYPVTVNRYNLKQSDSLYELFDSDGSRSHFYLFNGNEKIFGCPLKMFSREFAMIKSKILGGELENLLVKLPDSLSYDNVVLAASGNNFLLFNRTFQEVLFFNGNQFHFFSPDQIDIASMYDYFDKSGEYKMLFEKYYEVLAKLGQTAVSIQDFYLDSETAILWIEVPYPIMQSNGRLGVMRKPLLYQLNLKTWMQTWLFISDEKLPEGFYFSPQKPIVLNLSGNIVFCLKYIGEKVNQDRKSTRLNSSHYS